MRHTIDAQYDIEQNTELYRLTDLLLSMNVNIVIIGFFI